MKFIIKYLIIIYPFFLYGQNDDALNLAKRYLATGDVFYGKSQLDSSNYYYQKAADVYKSEAEKNNDIKIWESHIKCLYYLSWNLQLQANFNKALEVSIPLLEIAQQKLGIANSLTLKINDGIGVIYKGKSEINLALKYHHEVLKTRIDSLGKNHRDVATSYINIGIAYRHLGNNDLALEAYLKALHLRKKLFGEKHVLIGHNYNNLGLIFVQKQSFDLGIEYQNRALQIYEETSPQNKSLHAGVYINLGIAYNNKKDFNKALESSKKALKLYKKIFGSKHEHVAKAYTIMGRIYKNLENKDLALKYFNKSLKLRKELFGENHYGVGFNCNNLGDFHLNEQAYDQAISYYKRAITIFRNVFGNKSADLSVSYYNLGKSLLEKKDFESALSMAQKSLSANCIEFNDSTDVYKNPMPVGYVDIYSLLDSYHLKANALLRSGHEKSLDLSISTYELCDLVIEKIRQSHFRKSDQIYFAEKAALIYQELIELYYQLYKKDQEYKFLEKAFYYAEKSKSFVLFNSISENMAKQFSGIPDSLLAKEKEIKVSKSFFQQKLLSKPDSLETIKYKNKLFSLNREYEELISSFEKKFPKYYNLKLNPNIILLKEVQNKLSANTAIVEYYIGASALYSFYIDKNKISFNKILLNKDLSSDVMSINQFLKNGKVKNYARNAYSLYNILFNNIDGIEEKKKLVIIPDGPLWYLSYDLLLTKRPNKQQFKDFAYLINSYSISYAYSANLLHQSNENQFINKKMECLAFSYGNEDKTNTGKQMSLRSFRDSDLSDLPGSRKEIAAVSKIMDGKYFYGNEASEKNFKQNAPGYAILHLALHGTIDEKDPMNSKLYFTPKNDLEKDTAASNSSEDEFLHAYELYNMSLNSEMVVLSACNTGSGKLEKGEGVMSLGRAFTYAGCKSMVISQWKLSDYATPIIMESFYKHLEKGKPKDEALREAKLEYIDQADNLMSNPYLWASLVQIGDASPLPFSRKNWYLVLAAVLVLSIVGFMWKTSRVK